MKSYTDIEQSKKLAEILPIESADMFYRDSDSNDVKLMWEHIAPKVTTPCWSLAALLEVIRVECRMEKTPLDQSGEFTYSMVDDYNNIRTFECGNPIDACVEMIIKLNEQKLL